MEIDMQQPLDVSSNITMNVTQWASLKEAIFYSHIQWGIICMAIGLCFGLWIMYEWKQREIHKMKKRKYVRKVKNDPV